MLQIDGKNYLTVRDVMQAINCSRITVFRLAENGRITKIKVAGKLYFEESEINNLFKRGE